MSEYNKNDPATIQKMFNSIAKQYDRTNAILSFRMYKRWNRTLIDKVIAPANPEVLLDLCCGTGAIAFEYLKKAQDPIKVYMLDFSEEMLQHAKVRAKKYDVDQHNIHYLHADAQKIPLLSNSVNCATIAYGVRNIKDPSLCLKDVYRVLKHGGSFGILELTQPRNRFMRLGHSLYLKHFLPIIGKMFTSNKEAYSYLCNSIHAFTPKELRQQMENVGFKDVKQFSLFGGVATVLVGTKS